MFCALWGAFMVSILVLVVSQFFQLEKKQTDALQKIKVAKVAVKSIIKAFQFAKAKKQYHIFLERYDPNYKSEFLDRFRNRQKTGTQFAESFSQMG